MVIREWRGRVNADRSSAYPLHFRTKVMPALKDIPGFAGATLSQRSVGASVEFLVLSRWESMRSVVGFAGSDFHRAVVEPGAVAALADFDETVQHYEVIVEVDPGE